MSVALAVEVTKTMGGVYLDPESERDRAMLAQPELYFDDHQIFGVQS